MPEFARTKFRAPDLFWGLGGADEGEERAGGARSHSADGPVKVALRGGALAGPGAAEAVHPDLATHAGVPDDKCRNGSGE